MEGIDEGKMDATEGVFTDIRRNTTLPITPEHAPLDPRTKAHTNSPTHSNSSS